MENPQPFLITRFIRKNLKILTKYGVYNIINTLIETEAKSMNEKKEESTLNKQIVVANAVPPEKKVVCDMCGYANPENTAICIMCSNYLERR